jgi:reactive intermediate/imine deaminase
MSPGPAHHPDFTVTTGIVTWTFGPAEGVPAPVAPYSHAVAVGDLLHVTGQLPVDPATGALVGGDVSAQTDVVMGHLARVLELCGSSTGAVVQVRAFLTSMDLYADFNRAYERWFTPPLPARTCVAISGLALGALVEVDLVAARDGALVRSPAGEPA